MLHINTVPAFGLSQSVLQNENSLNSTSLKGKADVNSKTPSTKRRAFGDISNRKVTSKSSQKDFLQQLQQPSKKTVSLQLSKTPAGQNSLLLPARTQKATPYTAPSDLTRPRSVRSAQKNSSSPKTPTGEQKSLVEDVEHPAGRVYSRQSDWSDDERSDCSITKFTHDSWQALENIHNDRDRKQKCDFEAQIREGEVEYTTMMDLLGMEDSLGMQAPDDIFSVAPIDLSLEDNEDYLRCIPITDISF